MRKLFEYNWQVRNDWFKWCESVSEEELLKMRIGGVGGILHTLLHIADVEYSWICGMQGKPDPEAPPFEEYASLQKVKQFSDRFHPEVKEFVYAWNSAMENNIFSEQNVEGELETYKHGEIMRHMIAHEIHHIGQLSVWAREIGKQPVTANLIRRGLFDE